MAKTSHLYLEKNQHIYKFHFIMYKGRKSPLHSHNLMIKKHQLAPRVACLIVPCCLYSVTVQSTMKKCHGEAVKSHNATGNLTGLVSLFKTHLLAQSRRLLGCPIPHLLHASCSTLLYLTTLSGLVTKNIYVRESNNPAPMFSA